MGPGQGWQSSVALDLADLGRVYRALPDACMGHLDHRWLASVSGRSGDTTLARSDHQLIAIRVPIARTVRGSSWWLSVASSGVSESRRRGGPLQLSPTSFRHTRSVSCNFAADCRRYGVQHHRYPLASILHHLPVR